MYKMAFLREKRQNLYAYRQELFCFAINNIESYKIAPIESESDNPESFPLESRQCIVFH